MPINFPLLSLMGTPTDGVSAVQLLVPSGSISGGDFTLDYDGDTTAAIPYDATPEDVQAALEELAALTDNVAVTGDDPDEPTLLSAGGTYTIMFVGSLAGLEVETLTVDDAGLTGKGPALDISEDTAGVRGTYRGAQAGAVIQDQLNGLLFVNYGSALVPQWVDFTTEEV